MPPSDTANQPVLPEPPSNPATSVVADGIGQPPGTDLLRLAAMVLLGLVGAALLISFVATSGGTKAGDAGVSTVTHTISVILSQEPPQLDSTQATDQVSFQILGHVMEGLIRYDANNQLAPGVAERWEIRPDGATFWLRQNARWNDGQPVTAHDFVYGWQTVVDPATASQYAFILFPIKNAESINQGRMPSTTLGAVATNDFQLDVTFEQPVAFFDKLVAFAVYFPVREDFHKAQNGRYGADVEHLLYNGPFKLSRWIHAAQLTMEKNPDYWDPDLVRIQTIEVPYITSDANAGLNLFRDGKIAWAGLNAETLDSALDNRWRIEKELTGSIYFLELNHRPGRPTANYHLRKALQLTFDPGELVYKVIKIPGNLPAVSLFPAWLKGAHDSLRVEQPPPEHRVDLDRAREHLALAKQELGVDEIPPLTLLSGDSATANKQAEYFQNLWSQTLGLTVKIDRQIFKQRLAKMTSGDFDLVAAGWGPDYDDPLTFGDLFSSWNLNNRGRYANQELDDWVRVAQGSIDPVERSHAFGEIQRILYEDAPIIHQYEQGKIYVQDPRLKGVVRRAVGHSPDYTYAWIEPDQSASE